MASESQPGEKGPPAWQERDPEGDEPIPDEPPDSSSEVGQEQGLPPDPADEDTSED